MSETMVNDPATKVNKPTTIAVPPRGSMESFFGSGSIPGFSPGPMTLVSSLFSDQNSPFSFSQLLAGAMTSPAPDIRKGKDDASKEKDGEGEAGYKRNRPMELVVAQPHQMQGDASQGLGLSPLFMLPPGLSPSGLLNSPGFLSPLQSPFGMSHRQALAHVTAQAAFSQSYMQMQAELQRSSSSAPQEPFAQNSTSAPNNTSQHQTNALPLVESVTSNLDSSEVSPPDNKAIPVGDKPANDGYNWRKYGQKQVKASEYPRSYYKCTHPNCPVKKKVERSPDGHVIEITYKGQHNHDKPQPTKRGKDNNSAPNGQVLGSHGQTEMNKGNGEGVATPPYTAPPQAYESSTQKKSNVIEMEASIIDVDEGSNDEPDPKRRSIEAGPSLQAPIQKTVTESKIVVQTRSEVDLLDDGYKWRKYGQKVVKGNPHPRSYYRCTYTGCNVRKHVERSAADPKAVITTYEGKHNHDLPPGRYSINAPSNNAAPQLQQPQNTAANNPSLRKDMSYENRDNIPMTLQLKEEQIAA